MSCIDSNLVLRWILTLGAVVGFAELARWWWRRRSGSTAALEFTRKAQASMRARETKREKEEQEIDAVAEVGHREIDEREPVSDPTTEDVAELFERIDRMGDK